ncbi:MAG: hypothetical protein Q9161_003914 [Pseudevernia consocians]
MADRETGTVKKWNEKGFGFIERDGVGDRIFVHARDTADRQALTPGSKVSFVYEPDERGGKAKDVTVEEMAEAVMLDEGPREMVDKKLIALLSAFFHKKSYGGHDEPYVGQAVSFFSEQGPKGAAATKVKEEQAGMAVEEALVEDEGEREMGTVKGFGFIGRVSGEEDAFFHKKSFAGINEPYVGQAVSFIFEEGPKGTAAVKVKEEEGGITEEKEDEREREMGKVKTYSEEKGFTFIARCVDGTEIFGHKREFPQGVVPYVGQPVSFIYENTEKGGSAKKNFNREKGFGFIVARKGGDEVRFFEKALNEVVPEKNTCVSFVQEEGEKGLLAKDLRKEDPERVARVTAKVHYGKVVIYKDPPPSKPDSGYGFIVELDQLNVKKPKKHYFHMWEIMTPDDKGESIVSFIIIPARKGFQAAAVTIADPPKEEEADPENGRLLEKVMEEMNVGEANETTTDATNGDWGSGTW